MSIEAMKQTLDALTYIHAETSQEEDIVIDAAIATLRAAIEQAEKQEPVAWRWKELVNGEFVSNWVLTHSEPPPYATESMPLYTAPRQEQYDQTSLELCEECGWRTMIPGDGCLVCARQKAKPVAYKYTGIKQDGSTHGPHLTWKPEYMDAMSASKGAVAIPLYAAPRQWVGLTNKDIIEMWPETSTVGWDDIRLIEAKLKEKNAP